MCPPSALSTPAGASGPSEASGVCGWQEVKGGRPQIEGGEHSLPGAQGGALSPHTTTPFTKRPLPDEKAAHPQAHR